MLLSGRRCNFRDDRTVFFALEAYLDLTQPCLGLEDVIPPDATVTVKRVPGETIRPFAYSLTEDQRIKAWVNHVADTWQREVRDARREFAQSRRRRAIGIPSSMLRLAKTEDEKERALVGTGGTLVVKKDNEKPFSIFDVM